MAGCAAAYGRGILVTHRETQKMNVWNLHSQVTHMPPLHPWFCVCDCVHPLADRLIGRTALVLQGMHSLDLVPGVSTVLPMAQGKKVLAAGARGTEYIYTIGPTNGPPGRQVDVQGTVVSSVLLQLEHKGGDERTPIIACGCEDGSVSLHDDKTMERLQRLEGHTLAVHCMTTINNSAWLVTGSEDGSLIVWKPGRIHRTHIFDKYGQLRGHTQPVMCCCEVLPDSTLASKSPCVVSGGADKTVIIWDCEACVKLASLLGHDKTVWTCCALQSRNCIVTGSSDETLKIWKLKWSRWSESVGQLDGVRHAILEEEEDEILGGGQPASSLRGGTSAPSMVGRSHSTAIKPITSLRCKAFQEEQLVGHRGEVKSSIALNDDTWVLSGSPMDCLRLWDVNSGYQIHTFPLQAQWNGIMGMPMYGDIPTPCSAFVLTRSTFQNACFILDLSAGENRMPYQSEIWQCYVQPDRRSKTLTETKQLLQEWPGKILIEPDSRNSNRCAPRDSNSTYHPSCLYELVS